MKKYELGMYEKATPSDLDWEERFLVAKEAGYDYLEISIDETDSRLARLEWSQEERLKFIELMYKTGMPVRSMCLSGHRKYPMGSSDPETEKRSMDIMSKAIRLASDLGIRIIQLAGYDVYYEEHTAQTDERFRKNLALASLEAAQYGIVMGFETMETEYMNTVGKAMGFVDLIGSPYLGVYPDSGNITNAAKSYGRDVLDDLRSGEGHLVALHLKETVPGVFREVRFGTGHVDFNSMISAAWDMGVRRYVTELWCTGDDWKDRILEARKMMGDILDRM